MSSGKKGSRAKKESAWTPELVGDLVKNTYGLGEVFSRRMHATTISLDAIHEELRLRNIFQYLVDWDEEQSDGPTKEQIVAAYNRLEDCHGWIQEAIEERKSHEERRNRRRKSKGKEKEGAGKDGAGGEEEEERAS